MRIRFHIGPRFITSYTISCQELCFSRRSRTLQQCSDGRWHVTCPLNDLALSLDLEMRAVVSRRQVHTLDLELYHRTYPIRAVSSPSQANQGGFTSTILTSGTSTSEQDRIRCSVLDWPPVHALSPQSADDVNAVRYLVISRACSPTTSRPAAGILLPIAPRMPSPHIDLMVRVSKLCFASMLKSLCLTFIYLLLVHV
ncbi:hypothetical protein FPV67DRAFT_932133 [Lyophyllum atratum]|nr:hypothetical protein FPV67DRAFT_932133 [Lyophyllum atratum]